MKNTLKTIIYMSALCGFLFNIVQLDAAAVPGGAPAAGGPIAAGGDSGTE